MSRLRRFLHKSRSESVLDKELRFHLERQIADYLAAGMSAEEARRRACLEFGGLERVKEEVRDTRWETYLDNLFRDLRYTFRTLCRDRRFALIAIFAIALGIGSTSVVFSVIYNGLLRSFPYREAHRLTTFYVHDIQDANRQEAGRGDRGGFTSAEFLNLREQSHAFEDIIGFMTRDVSCANDQATLQLHAAFVTPNTFQFLGVDPLLGRSIILGARRHGASISVDGACGGRTIKYHDFSKCIPSLIPCAATRGLRSSSARRTSHPKQSAAGP